MADQKEKCPECWHPWRYHEPSGCVGSAGDDGLCGCEEKPPDLMTNQKEMCPHCGELLDTEAASYIFAPQVRILQERIVIMEKLVGNLLDLIMDALREETAERNKR